MVGGPGSRFRSAVLQKYGITDESSLAGNPLVQGWLDYSFATVKRGEHAVHVLSQATPIAGKSFLDVGCAYGGFLLAFRAAGAARVVGIDIDDALLACARALVADENVSGCEIVKASLADQAALQRLGRFDLVTCYDVIEHVEDSADALGKLCSLTTPGGLINLEIPNRRCPANVLNDPHFQWFGFSLLPRDLAQRYYAARIPGGPGNDVRYGELDQYLQAVRRTGLSTVLINRPDAPEKVLEETASDLKACAEQLQGPWADGLDPGVVRSVQTEVERLKAGFDRDLARWRACPPGADADRRRDDLVARYGIQTWQMLVGPQHVLSDLGLRVERVEDVPPQPVPEAAKEGRLPGMLRQAERLVGVVLPRGSRRRKLARRIRDLIR